MWIPGDVYCFQDGTAEGSISTTEGEIKIRPAKGPPSVSSLRALGEIENLTYGNLWQWFANYYGSHEAVSFFAINDSEEQQRTARAVIGRPLPVSGTIYLPVPGDEITPEIKESLAKGKCEINWGESINPRAYVATWEAARIIFSGNLPGPNRIQELETIKSAIEVRRVHGHSEKEDHEAQLAKRLFYLGDARDYEKIGRSLKVGIEYIAPDGAPLRMMNISDLEGMENFELISCDVAWEEKNTRLIEEGELIADVASIEMEDGSPWLEGIKSKFPLMTRKWGWPGYQVRRSEAEQIPLDAKPSFIRKHCTRVRNFFIPRGTIKLKKRTPFPLLWLTMNELFEELEAVGSSEPHNLCFCCRESTKPGKPTCGKDACRQFYRYHTDAEYRRKKLGY